METPILITDDQKRAFLKDKSEKFMEGLKKLQDETGLTLIADLAISPNGIFPRIQIVPKNEQAPIKKN